jgi:transposase
MAAALAMELRARVMKDIDAGISVERVAEKYSVSARTIYNWKALVREKGTFQARDGKPGPKRKLEDSREAILAAVGEDSGMTLEELKAKLDLPVCLSTVWMALKAWGIVLKKSPAGSRTTAT